jgi:hypothetical protein
MRRLGIQRFRAPALTVALVGLFALPANASAARVATTTVLPDGTGTATATCPEGSRATGGGFRFLPASLGGGAIQENRKVGQRRWRVTVQGQSSGVPFTVAAIAYCSKNASRTKQRQSAFQPNITDFKPIVAECESGDKAHAGGFITDPPFTFGVFVNSSVRANPSKWATENGAITPGKVRSFAYCKGSGTPASRSGTLNTDTAGAYSVLSNQCTDGTRPKAGGFSHVGPFGTFVFVYESFKVGKRWQTSFFKPGDFPSSLTSVAYCS